MITGLPQIPCTEIVARAVDPDQLTNTVPRTVRKAAFIPRKNGKDNEGLSITVVRPGVLGLLRERLGSPSKEAATLHVGRVRTVSADGHSLDVTPDPVGGDSQHALIVGFPKRHADATESPQEKAAWNRLAELLAQQARCCLRS
jgi:hypothetical protein